jgi:hypothetical protein
LRDCLVETHCWGKCDEEVQRFQECINTKYFEEIVVEREVESSDDSLEPEEVITIEEEVKAEGGDENGDQSNDYNAKINEEPPASNEKMKEDDSVHDEKPEEQPVETDVSVEIVNNKDVETTTDPDKTNVDESDTVDKDAFRIKIVSKSKKEVQEDEK